MADQIYYSVFTKQGLALLTQAIQNGTKLGITAMAFGDGGGSLPEPNENFTALINEVHRTQLNSLAPDPNNANWLRAEAIIASAIGGFNIRELGLYAGDVLIAYSNYPATYKPNPADGTARIMTFRMILQIDNVANFELVIDPDVVLATIQSVNDAKNELYDNTVNTVDSLADLENLEKIVGRIVYVKKMCGSYESDGQKWHFKDKLIVPDLFLASTNNDDLLAFKAASVAANQLQLPITLLSKTYEFNDSVDLRIASRGVQAINTSLFSATVLKAVANPSNKSTFCSYRNIDRRKFSNITIDGNGLYDTVLDTSYDLQLGPSLNITFENIIVRGYKKIGWLAENNSDVYFKQCCVFEPKNEATTDLVSLKCITIGGPAQFTCSNFLNGKLQVAAQHVETNQCVTRGIEFLEGSWNVYSAVGTHHFADDETNSVFILTGEVWGLNVTGGLCEANNEGYLFYGNGGKLVSSKLSFKDTRISPDQGNMYLEKGYISGSFGNIVISIDGGFCGLYSKKPTPSGFIADVELIKVNFSGITESKEIISSVSGLRTTNTPSTTTRKDSYADSNNFCAMDKSTFLYSSSAYFGIIDFLSANKIASGTLHVGSSTGKQYARFSVQNLRKDDGTVQMTLVEEINVSSNTNKLYLYIDDNAIQVSLARDSGDSSLQKIGIEFVGFAFD